jgi:hypothetical protein
MIDFNLIPHYDFICSAVIGTIVGVIVIKLGSGPSLFLNDVSSGTGSAIVTGDASSDGTLPVKKKSDKSTNQATSVRNNQNMRHRKNTSGEELKDDRIITDDKVIQIDKEKAMKKLATMQKFLGLTDKQMEDAITATNQEISSQNPASEEPSSATASAPFDPAATASSIADIIIMLLAVVFGFVVLNVFSHGDFGRILTGIFPAEMSSLKVKEYLDNFHLWKK